MQKAKSPPDSPPVGPDKPGSCLFRRCNFRSRLKSVFSPHAKENISPSPPGIHSPVNPISHTLPLPPLLSVEVSQFSTFLALVFILSVGSFFLPSFLHACESLFFKCCQKSVSLHRIISLPLLPPQGREPCRSNSSPAMPRGVYFSPSFAIFLPIRSSPSHFSLFHHPD